jgi:hypothetical protein
LALLVVAIHLIYGLSYRHLATELYATSIWELFLKVLRMQRNVLN